MKSPEKWVPRKIDRSIWIVLGAIIYQFVLVFHIEIAYRFPEKETGFVFIALFFVILYVLLFYLSKRDISVRLPNFPKKISRVRFSPKQANNLYLLFVILITLVGIGVRIWVIRWLPFSYEYGDMLPLIQKAGTALLQGQNPYQVYYFSYALPLTFWPGLWLPFVPAILGRFDLRWAGLFAWLLISIIMIVYGLISAKRKSSSKQLLGSSIFILLLQTSINLVSFQGIGHTFFLWLWLLLLGICLLEGRYFWSAVLLGLVLASRQTAINYVIPVLLFWYHRVGFKTTIKFGLFSLATLSFLVLPFIVASPRQFILAPLEHYQYLASYAMSLGTGGWTSNAIGFAYLIQKRWNAEVLSMLSYLIIGVLGVVAWWKARNPIDMMLLMASSIVFFSFFTPIPWDYEYYPALIFLSLAYLAS